MPSMSRRSRSVPFSMSTANSSVPVSCARVPVSARCTAVRFFTVERTNDMNLRVLPVRRFPELGTFTWGRCKAVCRSGRGEGTGKAK